MPSCRRCGSAPGRAGSRVSAAGGPTPGAGVVLGDPRRVETGEGGVVMVCLWLCFLVFKSSGEKSRRR